MVIAGTLTFWLGKFSFVLIFRQKKAKAQSVHRGEGLFSYIQHRIL